jgi:hypothetical protein
MKKILSIIEVFLFVLTAITCYFGFKLVKGGQEMFIIISMLYAGFYFFCSAFLFRKNEKSENSALDYIATGLTGIILSHFVISFVFKINLWPSADLQLKLNHYGLLLALIVFLILSFTSKSRDYLKIISRVLIFLVLGIFLFQVSKIQFIESKYKEHPAFIEAWKEQIADPSDPEKLLKLREEREKIEK